MFASLEANTTTQRTRTLATADLPRRVRAALERLHALTSDALTRQLDGMLSEFEAQLFKRADQAHNPALQGGYFETLRRVRLHRAEVSPRFLAGLEDALASIRETDRGTDAPSADISFDELRLVDDSDTNEESVLRGIAARHQSRSSLPLLLLGQRFGVLAGAPAFEAEALPVGPHRLSLLLADASQVLDIDESARLMLFESFNTQVLGGYAQLVEAMNSLLARENVLPGLSYVPIRARPTEQEPEQSGASNEPPVRTRANVQAAYPGAQLPASQRPHTRWAGDVRDEPGDPVDEGTALSTLQELLASRREVLGKLQKGDAEMRNRKPLETPDVLRALADRQKQAPDPSSRPRTIADLKQALLAQGRQKHGEAIRLSPGDEDTFELLGLLYTEIGRELREGTTSATLLERLQVPLLRLALADRAFFVRSQHPARQLVNTVAEAGAKWLGEDDRDPRLERHLKQAVDHVVENYEGDSQVFEAANEAVQTQLQAMARKAELMEKRHVEAARGKEKLVVAKRRAVEFIGETLDQRKMPRFLRNLLDQAWTDVLTLTLLRHGEDSTEWREATEATRRLVDAGTGTQAPPEGLDKHVEQALAQVGYHQDEATAISRHLTGARDDSEDDPASRTELAMKIKARTRLGDDAETAAPKKLSPRNPHEQGCYEHLRTLPFGTWMEFVLNQQGDAIRRRIAWYSTVTDRVLFVNQRGQRVDEQSLDHVARLMAQGQVKVVTADRGRLIDRAWQATIGALRNFAGLPAQPLGAT